jgi:hypothetical protein
MIAKSTLSALAFAVMLVACTPSPPPAPTQAQIQDFIRDYVAAFNAGVDRR